MITTAAENCSFYITYVKITINTHTWYIKIVRQEEIYEVAFGILHCY